MVSGTYHVCKYVGVCSIIMWTRIYDGDLIILACVWMVPTATGMRTSSTQSENVIMNKTRRAREEWENCKGFWGPLHCTNHQEVFFCDEVKSSSLWGNDGDWMPITSQQFNKVNYHFKKYCASLGPRRLKLWICYLTFYSRTFRNRFVERGEVLLCLLWQHPDANFGQFRAYCCSDLLCENRHDIFQAAQISFLLWISSSGALNWGVSHILDVLYVRRHINNIISHIALRCGAKKFGSCSPAQAFFQVSKVQFFREILLISQNLKPWHGQVIFVTAP